MSTTTGHGISTGAQLRERLVAAMSLAERRETLAGVPTAILERGDGPPMILLHGPGEFFGVWMQVTDDLARSHRVVAIAARYAVDHSTRLSHLVLVDTMGLTWYRPSPRFGISLVAFMARPTETSRDRVFRECFVDFDAVGVGFGEYWADLRAYALDRARTPTAKAALRSLMPRVGVPPIPVEDLERLTVPTTVVHGRHDLQVPLRAAERASQRYGWPLHVIEGARDDPASERPAELVAAVHRALTT